MANQEVKVILQGVDKTGAAFKSASKSTQVLSKDVSGLSKILGGAVLAGGAALTGFLISSAKAASEDQVALAKVTATLTAMGAAALKNKDALLQASQAALKLGFDDEAAAESIAKLYQRTGDLTKATELNALAMDFARAKGIELSEATNVISLALSGGGRALKDYGIEISDTLPPLEALKFLQGQVAGQAEGFAKTFPGQMAILNESFTNLKSTIGAALLEAINPFIQKLSIWASNPDVQQKVKEIATTLGEFAAVTLPVVIESLRILFSVFSTIYDIMIKVGNAIIAVVNALDKLAKSSTGKALGSAGKAIFNSIPGVSAIRGLTGLASGGPVTGGTSYLVGEQGPELFTPSSSGRIVPNGMLAGAGGGNFTINISGNTLLDSSAGEKIAKQIMDVLKGNIRI